AASGEAAIAFRLTGPSFAVGGGPHGGIEALMVARDLVRDGVAERIVVVAADDARRSAGIAAPGTKTGAVALLVAAAPVPGGGRIEEISVRLEPDRMPADLCAAAPMHAHGALVPFAADPPADTASAALPWGGF